MQNDLVPTTLKYPDHDGETFSVRHSPNHKWKYLRGMTPEEIVLIKWWVLNLVQKFTCAEDVISVLTRFKMGALRS